MILVVEPGISVPALSRIKCQPKQAVQKHLCQEAGQTDEESMLDYGQQGQEMTCMDVLLQAQNSPYQPAGNQGRLPWWTRSFWLNSNERKRHTKSWNKTQVIQKKGRNTVWTHSDGLKDSKVHLELNLEGTWRATRKVSKHTKDKKVDLWVGNHA